MRHGFQGLFAVVVAQVHLDGFGQDDAGTDDVGADALLAEPRRDMAGKRMDRVLGHRIGDLPRRPARCRAGRGIDHRPAATFQHHRKRRLRGKKMALGIDRKALVQHFDRAVQRVDVAFGAAGKVGMIDVQPAERVDRSLNDGGLRCRIGAVQRHGQRLATGGLDRIGGFSRQIDQQIADHHVRAFFGQPPRRRRADAARAAGNNGSLALQTSHDTLLNKMSPQTAGKRLMFSRSPIRMIPFSLQT